MMNKLLFVLFLFITQISFGQLEKTGQPFKGIQAARDSVGKYWLLNKHDVKVISVDSLSFSVTEVMEKIEASTMPSVDKQLIRKMVNALPDDQKKMDRLWGVSRNFKAVDPIVMGALYDSLIVKYGKRKVKKMLKAKK